MKVKCTNCEQVVDAKLPSDASSPVLIKGTCPLCNKWFCNYDIETVEWLGLDKPKKKE